MINENELLRGSGRTTRLIDNYIQELFTNKEIEVRDHFDSMQAHRYLLNRIKERFNNEFYRGHQKLNINGLNVKLINI